MFHVFLYNLSFEGIWIYQKEEKCLGILMDSVAYRDFIFVAIEDEFSLLSFCSFNAEVRDGLV